MNFRAFVTLTPLFSAQTRSAKSCSQMWVRWLKIAEGLALAEAPKTQGLKAQRLPQFNYLQHYKHTTYQAKPARTR